MSKRDPRIDILRGLSLIMIFVDHIPGDTLNLVTLHNFGFCDAAEIFVLLAGFASMMAYGRAFDRDGPATGLRRLLLRCAQLYGFQVAMLISTLLIVQAWTTNFNLAPSPAVAELISGGLHNVKLSLTLRLLPTYLDILPLYIVLLMLFPLLYYGMRRNVLVTVLCSGVVWLAVQLDPSINLPNALDAKGWYFNPFAWQFIFTLGAALAVIMTKSEDVLPRRRWAMVLSAIFLGFALLQAAPWKTWGLPDLSLIAMAPPEKSTLAPLRLLDVTALFYLILSSRGIAALARSRVMWGLEVCGKHSLHIFALGCMLALIGRLTLRTFGNDVLMQVVINAVGMAAMVGLAGWLELRRRPGSRPELPNDHDPAVAKA